MDKAQKYLSLEKKTGGSVEVRGVCTICRKQNDDEHYKRCTKCRDRLIDYYNRRGRVLRGYASAKQYRKQRRNSKGLIELECTKCGNFKSDVDFRKSKYHRHGRHTVCNRCLARSTPSYEERVRRAMQKGMSEGDARYYCSKGRKRWKEKYINKNYFKRKNNFLFVRAVA